MFYVGYRNPGLLAKAAITLDHLSGGRFELGIGGGWHEVEARAYGYDFPGVGVRLDMLDEAATLIRGLLAVPADAASEADEPRRTSFDGEHFRLANASCLPGPVGARLPLWIGGRGEKRTLRITARHADGWNAAYVSAAEFGRLNGVLDQWCETEGRDPATIERSVNLSFGLGVDRAQADRYLDETRRSWGPMADRIIDGSLTGTPDEAAEQVLAYVEQGASLVNIALRAPFDAEALRAYVESVIPVVRESGGG